MLAREANFVIQPVTLNAADGAMDVIFIEQVGGILGGIFGGILGMGGGFMADISICSTISLCLAVFGSGFAKGDPVLLVATGGSTTGGFGEGGFTMGGPVVLVEAKGAGTGGVGNGGCTKGDEVELIATGGGATGGFFGDGLAKGALVMLIATGAFLGGNFTEGGPVWFIDAIGALTGDAFAIVPTSANAIGEDVGDFFGGDFTKGEGAFLFAADRDTAEGVFGGVFAMGGGTAGGAFGSGVSFPSSLKDKVLAKGSSVREGR